MTQLIPILRQDEILNTHVAVTCLASSVITPELDALNPLFDSMDDFLHNMNLANAQTQLDSARLKEGFHQLHIELEALEKTVNFLQAEMKSQFASFKRRNKCYIHVLLRDANKLTTSKIYLSKRAQDLLIKFASQNVPRYNESTATGDDYLLCTIKIAVLAEQSAEKMNALKEIFVYAYSEPCEFDDESDEGGWTEDEECSQG